MALFAMTVVAHASDVFVSPSGSGSTCSSGVPCSVATGIANVTIPGTVHFLDGIYPNITISKGGTSTANRLVYQCENGIASASAAQGHCNFHNSGQAWILGTGANNLDIRGFDIGANGNMNVAIVGLPCGGRTVS